MCQRALPKLKGLQKTRQKHKNEKGERHSLKPINLQLSNIQVMAHAPKGSDKLIL